MEKPQLKIIKFQTKKENIFADKKVTVPLKFNSVNLWLLQYAGLPSFQISFIVLINKNLSES